VMTEEDKNDRLSPLYIGAEKLLSLFSENDWSEFCLSYLLTDRDYSGVLGLAWEGKPGESHHHAHTGAKQSDKSKCNNNLKDIDCFTGPHFQGGNRNMTQM
ncbi:unnamed protein product, partial [Tetraodon nigroviridis]